MSTAEQLPLLRVYDLRDPDAWRQAHRHRSFWGKLYTDIHTLDLDHVALVFRPAPDEQPTPGTKKRTTTASRMAAEGLRRALEALDRGSPVWGGYGTNERVSTDHLIVQRKESAA